MSDREISRLRGSRGRFASRRGPAAAANGATDTNWSTGIPALSAEHRGSLAEAEADVAYRWAAGAATDRDVLDVGCGAGHGSAILLEGGARSVIGVDADPGAIELASRLYGERAKFTQAEPAALPFAANGFDLVVCFTAMEGPIDAIVMLDQLRELLAPGGLLLASLPLDPRRDELDGSPVSEPRQPADWELELGKRFDHVSSWRRRVCLGSSVVPAESDPPLALESANWLGSEPSEDHSLLIVAGDEPPPELEPGATLVGGRDLRAYHETVEAWQYRARRAEADGAAKHWELVASREAQRRLRKRLWHLEHRPLRKLFRVLRGKPANLGEGPPIRPPEREQDAWSYVEITPDVGGGFQLRGRRDHILRVNVRQAPL